MTTGSAPGDFENAYNALTRTTGLNVISRQTANALVERMLLGKESSKTIDITKKIAEAAAKGDTSLIFSLTDDLKKIKDSEQARTDKLQEVASGYTFTELLRAYPGEYRELVHELANLVLQTSEKGCAERFKRSRQAKKNPGSRPYAAPATYVIHWKAQSIEATKGAGAPKLPSSEREFYEFMGFSISEDGKSLDPATFKNSAGDQVTATKNAILADLLAGNPVWVDQGFRIELKGESVAQVA